MTLAPGVWRVDTYGSGTVNVSDGKTYRTRFGTAPINPFLSVYGPQHGVRESEWQRERQRFASALASFLNSGDRPSILDTMTRVSETRAESETGASITATGPFVDIDPPHCNWRQDDRPRARNARARLMDLVLGTEAKP